MKSNLSCCSPNNGTQDSKASTLLTADAGLTSDIYCSAHTAEAGKLKVTDPRTSRNEGSEVMGNWVHLLCDLDGEQRVTFTFSEKHSGGGSDSW